MGKDIAARLIEPLRDRYRRPLTDLRVSLLDRCNFRCPYCMPAERFPDDHRLRSAADRMSADELVRLLDVFAGHGLRKLRLTGGEPLLFRGLESLVARLRERWPWLEMALTTNGALLARQAAGLRKAGLDRLTVSLDAIDPDCFARLSGGRGQLGQVLDGITAARDAGFGPIKLNCVVIRGRNDHQVLPLVEHFRGTDTVLRFIEYMDVGTVNDWRADEVVSAAELRALIATRHPLLRRLDDPPGAVATGWRLVDGSLELGFIASVSAPFCAECSRARLSADGQLFTCLFAAEGHDLLQPLRDGASPAALAERLAAIWNGRDDRYSELRSQQLSEQPKAEMYHLGG